MPIYEKTLFTEINKEEIAIKRIVEFEPTEGYYFANSFGKDSGVVRHLLKKAGLLDRCECVYNWTTVDPPELLQFGKENCPETLISKPEMTMWQLIVKKRMPPTRLVRYCCEYLKERGGSGRLVVTGIRAKESFKRSKRKMLETCFRNKKKRYFNPIIDWTEQEVWEYTHREKIPYCRLYDEGFKRLGCIGCPMAGKNGQRKQFKRYPKHKAAYIRSFQSMVDSRIKDGLETQWETGQEVFDWWLKNNRKPEKDQMLMGFCN